MTSISPLIDPWLQRKDGLEKDGKEHFQSVEDRKKLVCYYRKNKLDRNLVI
jgi:hypothetical protein